MISLPGNIVFTTFDGMAMNLDVDTSMAQPSPGVGSSAPSRSRAPSSGAGESAPGAFAAMTPDDSVASTPGPGAGPSPVAGYGASQQPQQQQQSGASGSTLTEFTKRRNWPAKVIEELKDVLQIVDANGRIKYVSPSITALTGYTADEVKDCFLQGMIHADDLGVFTSEFNECISSGNQLRLFYRLKKKDGAYAIFESVGHAHRAAAKFAREADNQSPFCQAVFLMSRPYPNKNAGLLDSFLEHKMESERLQRRIAELRLEEAEEMEEAAQRRTWGFQSQSGRSDVTPSEDTTQAGPAPLHMATPNTINSNAAPFQTTTAVAAAAAAAAADSANTSSTPNADAPQSAMPPPGRPELRNTALTRENLEGIAGSRPDSIRDKMARYEAAVQGDTIEMLTGLRYQEGERSRGLTTGSGSPTLITGDVGIAIPLERDLRTGEKKKKKNKNKAVEEYVCTDCGTLESPEWRKGPSGPKTLCNACGLRWAKKEKKRSSMSEGASMGGPESRIEAVLNVEEAVPKADNAG